MSASGAPRTWVKVCGLTNEADARMAIEAGADALGFNLWPGSKRYILLDENAHWIEQLPKGPERIAVLVNAPLEEALRVASHPSIDAVQFHGDESAEYIAEFAKSGHRYLVARRLGPAASDPGQGIVAERLLIDAHVPGQFGGTGVAVDFHLASAYVQSHPDTKVILAGGLNPETVAAAVQQVRPYGVDVASGVERSPREKDPVKVEAFIAAAEVRTRAESPAVSQGILTLDTADSS